MTTIDTISFTTSVDYLRDIDLTKFKTSTTIKPNGLKIINHSLSERKTGLDKISFNTTLGTIRIKASSKILGNNYKKGISLLTIKQFTDEINKTGLVLDNDFIQDCSLSRVDIKNDLYLKKDAQSYINSMNHLIAPKFNKTLYETGISFNERIATTPIRLIGYDKQIEMMSKNKIFLKQYPTLINQFQGAFRLESSLSNTNTIKKYFKSNLLIDILNYKDINHQVFKKIIGNQISFNRIYDTSHMTNTEEKNFAQIYYLNHKYNGDFNNILNHIKSKLGNKTKATYQRELIKKHLAIINNSKNVKAIDDIMEILDCLKK